jgi:hypothetical protein
MERVIHILRTESQPWRIDFSSFRRRSGTMPEQPPTFRDFGILPDGLRPPAEKIRSFLSKGRIVGQYIGTGLVSALGLGLIMLFALTMPLSLGLLGCAAALAGFGAFVYLATHNDYRWVELEGNTLRAKHLYTGRVIERSVEDIESLGTMVYLVKSATAVVVENLLGRVKGIEIRFRDRRTPLRILRADPAMTNAQELIEAVLYRMKQVGELRADIINLDGQPLVRRIYWKGEQPRNPPGKTLKLVLCCLILLALMSGTGLGCEGIKLQERHEVGSVPPHDISVRSLIQNGPGANRHITITDFRPGGYAVMSKSKSWTTVWIALFPADARPAERKEIKVVLSSTDVRDEAALRQWLRRGRVTGICSAAPSTSWGTELGPRLVEANQGCPLSAAWSIEELRETPSAALVEGLLGGAVGCLAAVVVLALIVFWKAG